MWKLFIRLAVGLCTTFVLAAAQSCTIQLPDDINKLSPVILTSSSGDAFKLFKPTGKISSLSEGTNLKLLCTGKSNVFKDTTFDILQLKCSKGIFVDKNKTVQPLKKLECKFTPSSSLQITTEKCSHKNGYIYKIGFIKEGQFYGPVFEICYSKILEKTFYSHSTLNGAAMEYSISLSSRRLFSAIGMEYNTTEINTIYSHKNQIKRFEGFFGAGQSYLDSKNFLARGHLAAEADFILGYEKLSTFYYANVAPEYQLINAGNWLRVEELARQVSANYKDDIESYTSYMGTLELPNNNGLFVKIYLDDTYKIEVPLYFYKVLLHRASDSAIVFVTVNIPFKVFSTAVEFCTNVCTKSGLVHANFPDDTKGYTICCELNEFKKQVNSLPDEVRGSKLLKSTP